MGTNAVLSSSDTDVSQPRPLPTAATVSMLADSFIYSARLMSYRPHGFSMDDPCLIEYTFPSDFDMRVANYFRGIISDEAAEIGTQLNLTAITSGESEGEELVVRVKIFPEEELVSLQQLDLLMTQIRTVFLQSVQHGCRLLNAFR